MIKWLGVAIAAVIILLAVLDTHRRAQSPPQETSRPAAVQPAEPARSDAPRSIAPLRPAATPRFTRTDGVLFVNQTAEHKYDRALRGSVRGFAERTGIEMGMVLLPRLPPDRTIEELAVEIVESTRLGASQGGRSILFLWAEAERLFKIEVSYELEGVFPDSTCAHLEAGARTFMLASLPYARRDFLTEVIITMGLHWLDYKATGRLGELMLPKEAGGYQLSERYLTGGAGIVGRGYAATAAQIAREIVPMDAAGDETRAAATPQLAIDRFRALLARGVGDPRLALLTEGSRFWRLEQPQAPGYLRRIHAYQQKALPYQLIVKDDVAAAVFKPGTPVLPILARRNARGLWEIDEAGAWASFHLFENDMNPVLKYTASPYAFAWAESGLRKATHPIYHRRAAAPALPEAGVSLPERLARAERALAADPYSPERMVALADILHFEMYWLEAAGPLYEAALRGANDRDDLRWRLVDIYMNTTEVDGIERVLRGLWSRTRDAKAKDMLDIFARWYR